MKTSKNLSSVLAISSLILAMLACNFGKADATPTPLPPTNPPPVIIDTVTPLPTLPPEPTATEIPPTPASVGDNVKGSSFEITVVTARELTRVYMGNYYYYPSEGQIYIEAIVRVSNLTGSKAAIPWENIYVVEENGDAWYPTWGGYKAISSGATVDGSTVGVNEIVDGKEVVVFENDALMRLIWLLTRKNPTTVNFGIDDSPMVEITIQ